MPKITAGRASASEEEYLRALALLSSREDSDDVSTGKLSEYLGVAPASVTEMLGKLVEGGYVARSPYKGSRLTERGNREARRITRKHRLLERFLSDVLRIPVEEVHPQACAMEHSLSDEAEEALCRLLGHPDFCSDDRQVIPACDLPFTDCDSCMRGNEERKGRREENLSPLSALKTGDVGRVAFIRGEAAFVHAVQTLGIVPGARVSLGEWSGRGPSLAVSVGGSRITLRGDATAKVFVNVDSGRGER